MQYDSNNIAAKISAYSSGKIDKSEYPTGKETLSSQQHIIIGEVKFTYFPLEKTLVKETVIIKTH